MVMKHTKITILALFLSLRCICEEQGPAKSAAELEACTPPPAKLFRCETPVWRRWGGLSVFNEGENPFEGHFYLLF